MIVIGLITILVIISQNKNLSLNTTGYNLRSSLGASVYPAYNYTNTGNYVQQDDYWYRSNSNTTSTTYKYDIPVTPTTTTTTKYYYYSYPQGQTYTNDYYDYYGGTNYQGYVPRGCESGTDYSTVDGQPCG